MSRVLPILFNTDMVRAILDGRKTVTRRLIKVPPYYPHFYKLHDNADGAITGTRNRLYAGFYKDDQIFYIDGGKHVDAVYYQAPCEPGDILYVRETWCKTDCFGACNGYVYRSEKADTLKILEETTGFIPKWHPSIHMPKEAARIWLKVKDVRVERLQEITIDDIRNEGLTSMSVHAGDMEIALEEWKILWNSTIKNSDLDRYGWDASPWVWVIEFERCEKPEGWCV